MEDFDKDRSEVEQAIASSELQQAHTLAKAMHVKYHAFAREHVQVHALMMRIAQLQGHHHKVIGHWLAGYVFAVPVSWVQKNLGLVVPAFKAK